MLFAESVYDVDDAVFLAIHPILWINLDLNQLLASVAAHIEDLVVIEVPGLHVDEPFIYKRVILHQRLLVGSLNGNFSAGIIEALLDNA